MADAARPLRVLFVNTGIMGHATAARLIADAVKADPGIHATHLDLSAGLTVTERIVRRVLSIGPPPGSPGGGRTAARFRHELDAGIRAARRIGAIETREGRFDVIHFHTQAAAWASLRRMRRTPSIVSIDATQHLLSLMVPPGPLRRDYVAPARRDRRVYRAAAAIVATSRWAANDLARDQPECADRIHVLPYPVRLEPFGAAWIDERRSRPAGQPVRVLFIGGTYELKGGPELLDAWQHSGLSDRAELVIVTNSPAVDEGSLPAGVSVRRGVRAYTPEWLDLWRWADLFAMPTRMDAFGMVFQEAAAAGLPVIGTRMNAVPETVIDGETGLLVPIGDAGALVDALRRLVDHAPLRLAMGAAARRRMESTATVEGYGRALTSLIREVARG